MLKIIEKINKWREYSKEKKRITDELEQCTRYELFDIGIDRSDIPYIVETYMKKFKI